MKAYNEKQKSKSTNKKTKESEDMSNTKEVSEDNKEIKTIGIKKK